jgi:hypothetical protein
MSYLSFFYYFASKYQGEWEVIGFLLLLNIIETYMFQLPYMAVESMVYCKIECILPQIIAGNIFIVFLFSTKLII